MSSTTSSATKNSASLLSDQVEKGDPARDANANRFPKTCILQSEVTPAVARRAAELRRLARAGSAVDALVVALAEPSGTVLTGDRADLEALAAHARQVNIELI